MIIDFSITNFGPIKSKQTLSFEASNDVHLEPYYVTQVQTQAQPLRLLRLGVIYGANASGKSTILEALDFLRGMVRRPQKDKDSTLEFKPFLFDSHTLNKPTVLTLNFIYQRIRFHYHVEFNRQCILKEALDFYSPKKANLFTRITDEVNKFTSEIKFGSKAGIKKSDEKALLAATLWNMTTFAAFNKVNIDCEPMQLAINWFSDTLNRMIQPTDGYTAHIKAKMREDSLNTNDIITTLQRADFSINGIQQKKRPIDEASKILVEHLLNAPLPFGLGDVRRELLDEFNNQTDIYLSHDVDGSTFDLSLDDESSGTKRYLEFAYLLSTLNQNEFKVLPIDEFEASLHPDLIKHFLLRYLKSGTESQLLLTTHYRELLDERDLIRNDALWFTEKKQDASTELFSLADFPSDAIRKSSNVYNAYKIGKLGAVPHIKN